jgi:hypothetical protein
MVQVKPESYLQSVKYARYLPDSDILWFIRPIRKQVSIRVGGQRLFVFKTKDSAEWSAEIAAFSSGTVIGKISQADLVAGLLLLAEAV